MKKERKALGMNLTLRQQKLWDTLLFLLKVLVLSIPLYLIIMLGMSLALLQNLDASVSSGILRAFGYPVQQDGAYITVGSAKPFSFYLTEDCTPWKSFLLLFALVFAVPAVALASRLKGLAVGLPLLWLGNQARILGVVFTEQATSVQFAMLTHDYFWRAFLILLVLGVWYLWLKNPSLGFEMPYKQRFWTRKIPGGRASPRLISRKAKR